MKNSTLSLIACASFFALSSPAFADGDVRCDAGPVSSWADTASLKQSLERKGWEIRKIITSNDCYEVYGRTPEGERVEAFFHPITLRKLLVLRRGQELYRAKGFKG